MEHIVENTFVFPRWLGELYLKAFGWTVEGELPQIKKYIIVGAPHTSNWDFIQMLGLTAALRLHVHWIGKKSLFPGPFGWIMKWLGGIPVDRSRSEGVVDQMAAHIAAAERFALIVTPSGTRRKRDYWKSGFYWMAVKAQVPLLCISLDYSRRCIRIDKPYMPTGHVVRDMDTIRAFFAGAHGKYPPSEASIRLREEVDRSSQGEKS